MKTSRMPLKYLLHFIYILSNFDKGIHDTSLRIKFFMLLIQKWIRGGLSFHKDNLNGEFHLTRFQFQWEILGLLWKLLVFVMKEIKFGAYSGVPSILKMYLWISNLLPEQHFTLSILVTIKLIKNILINETAKIALYQEFFLTVSYSGSSHTPCTS